MSKRNHGYALIWVLLLALFLSFLLLSLGVENKISNLNARKKIARQCAEDNAILALNIAIAKLQKNAGRDDRITVNASGVPGASSNDIAVYDVSRNSDGIHFDKNFLCVLSSNLEQADSGSVKISHKGDDKIYANLVKITYKDGSISGRYAYFVDDESQKASLVSVDDSCNDRSDRARYIKQTCHQSFGLNFCDELSEIYTQSLSIYHKIDQLEQMKFVDKKYDDFEKFLHNFAIHSYGILSSIEHKKLKLDLTKFFTGEKDLSGNIFPVPTNCTIPPPTFQFLKSFAEVYGNEVVADANIFRPQEDASVNRSRSPTKHGFHPVMTKFALKIFIKNINGKIYLQLFPEIALWNPYNIDFASGSYSVTFSAMLRHSLKATIISDKNYEDIWLFDANNPPTFNFQCRVESGMVKILQPESFLINTGVPAPDRGEEFRIEFDNKGEWDFSHLRLFCDSKLLQDIYCYDSSKNSELNGQKFFTDEKKTLDSYMNTLNSCLFTINSRLSGVLKSDFSDFDCLRAVADGNCRASCMNFFFGATTITTSDEPEVPSWLQKTVISPVNKISPVGNLHWITRIKTGNFDESDSALRVLSGQTLFDVPLENIVPNVGFLRHVNFSPCSIGESYAVCGCCANPLLSVEKIFYTVANNSNLLKNAISHDSLVDYSFLLNDVLFDGYFCSTVDSSRNFSNKRFKVLNNGAAAKDLMIKHPLNVNSINENAWIAALAGNNDGETAKFYRVFDDKFAKKISQSQIKLVAQNLVKNIRNSARFATIGEFVNRAVPYNSTDAGEFIREGVVKNAIKKSGINSSFVNVTVDKNVWWLDDESASGAIEEGFAEFLSQGDVIAPMSHFLVSRGDTFIVRAYGDDWNDDSKTCSTHAICEAVVQRIPEFLNNFDSADSEFTELTALNQEFGRRFKVILFRWLE